MTEAVNDYERDEELQIYNAYNQYDTVKNINNIIDSAVNQILMNENQTSLAYDYLIKNKKLDSARMVLNKVEKRTIQISILKAAKHKAIALDFMVKTGYDDFLYNPEEIITPVIKDNKYGFYDRRSDIEIIEPKYSDIDFLFDKEIFLVKNNNRWGLIKYDGTKLFNCIFSEVNNFDHFIVIKENGKTGLLSDKGKLLKEPVYEEIYQTWNFRYIIKDERYYGLLDGSNKFILKMEYDSLWINLDSEEFIVNAKIHDNIVLFDFYGNIIEE